MQVVKRRLGYFSRQRAGPGGARWSVRDQAGLCGRNLRSRGEALQLQSRMRASCGGLRLVAAGERWQLLAKARGARHVHSSGRSVEIRAVRGLNNRRGEQLAGAISEAGLPRLASWDYSTGIHTYIHTWASFDTP